MHETDLYEFLSCFLGGFLDDELGAGKHFAINVFLLKK